MLKNVSLYLFFLLTFSSCDYSKQSATQLVYEDGRHKPQLTLLSVIDKSLHHLPWDLSEEFHQALFQELKTYASLYLKPIDSFSEIADLNGLTKKLQRTPLDPIDLGVKTEFLVSAEIIEHHISIQPQKIILSHPEAQSQLLQMQVRLKVFDIRKQPQELILSEIVNHELHIPWQHSTVNYNKIRFKMSAYKNTPFALAHKQLSQKVAKKIHDYVLLAKSK